MTTTIDDKEIGYPVSALPKNIEVTYTPGMIDSSPGIVLMCKCGLSMSTFVPVRDKHTIDIWASLHVGHTGPADQAKSDPMQNFRPATDDEPMVTVYRGEYSIGQLHSVTVNLATELFVRRHQDQGEIGSLADSCVHAAASFVDACVRSGLVKVESK